jgi:hypothetical protein
VGNEQMAKSWQNKQQDDKKALAVIESGKVTDVGQAIDTALRTRTPNALVMTFESTDKKTGEKIVAPYVRKAGMSVKLQEAAKKKGGIAKMYTICVRSAREKRSDLLDMMTAFTDEYKRQLIESRGGDFRFLTIPDGTAVYKYIVLFKSGEKWEGEGIANRDNIPMTTLDVRLDEMAETRAFRRCIGRALADGFITADQIAGDDDYDGAAEELFAEDAAIQEDYIDMEADPDGSGTFLSPNDVGEDGVIEGAGGPEAAQADDRGQGGVGAATGGASDPGGVEGEGGGVRGVPGGSGTERPATGHYASQAPSVDELMGIARRKGIMLVGLAQERFGKKLPLLTPDQRIALQEEMIGGEILDEETASS